MGAYSRLAPENDDKLSSWMIPTFVAEDATDHDDLPLLGQNLQDLHHLTSKRPGKTSTSGTPSNLVKRDPLLT